MVAESLLIDLQLLLQVLLFILFHAVARLMPGWGFMRWWTWGWAAFAALLVLYRLSVLESMPAIYSAGLYPRISPIVAFLQVAVFFIGARALLRGHEPPRRRSAAILAGAVVLGAGVGLVGPAVFQDDSVAFAFRAAPRSLGLAVVLPLCAYAFRRELARGRGWLFLVAPAGFLLYAANQLVYAAVGILEVLRDGLGIQGMERLQGLGSAFIFSPYATVSDIAWTAAIGLGTIVVVVSEAQRFQAALSESERRFREVFERAPTGMALLEGDGRVVDTNEALRALLARSTEELTGAALVSWSLPEDRGRLEALLRHAARGESPIQEDATSGHTVRFVRGDGAVVRADVFPTTVPSSGRDAPHLLLQLADMTERRALQEHLRQAHKLEAVGSLAAGMAHDFNNLLQAVGSNAELMRLDQGEDSPWRDELGEIGEAVRKGRSLNDQILAFAGKAGIRRRTVDLRTFFLETETFLRTTVPDGAAFEITCRGDVEVRADPERLLQLVSHLVANAGEAADSGAGRIQIFADRIAGGDLPDDVVFVPERPDRPAWIRLRVTDDGHGMEPETLERAYEPFYSTRFLGRGLGLSAALGIVTAHEGAMMVESAPGEGTAVTVLLPPVGKTAAPAWSEEEQSGWMGAPEGSRDGARPGAAKDSDLVPTEADAR